MASLGELVARMSLDIGQYVGALGKAEQETADAVRKMQKSFDALKGAVEGIAVGFLSMNAAAELFSQTVQRGANLSEMSGAFGIAADKLDTLSLAMELAGTDAATFEKQMKTLANQVTLASNPASESAAVFKAMGVEIKDASGNMLGMDEIYQNAIKQLGAIEDPALRASAAIKLFGKGADDALKAAAEYDQVMEEATKQTEAFGGSTDETAAMSKQFKQDMLLGADALQRLMLPVVKALLPVFESLRQAFAASSKDGVNLAADLGQGLAVALRVVGAAAIGVVAGFKAVGLWIGALAAAYAALMHGDIKGIGAIFSGVTQDIGATTSAAYDSAKAMLGLGDAHTEVAAAVQRNATNNGALQAALNKTKESQAAARAENEAYLAAMGAMEVAFAKASDASESWDAANLEQVKTLALIEKAEGTAKQFTDEHATSLMREASAVDQLTQRNKQLDAERKQALADGQKIEDARKAGVEILERATASEKAYEAALTDQTDASTRALNVLGLTATQMAIAAANEQIDIGLRKQLAQLDKDEQEARDKNVDGINDERIKAIEADKARAQSAADTAKAITDANLQAQDTFTYGWQKAFQSFADGLSAAKLAEDAFNSLSSSLETLFTNIMNGSKSAWATFKQSAISAIESVVSKIAVSGLLNMAGVATGGGGMLTGLLGAGASAALTSGAGQVAGDAFLPAALGVGGSAATGLGALGTSFTALGTVATDGVAALGGFSAALTATLPALGAIGIAGLAIYAAYQAFSKPGGGPKSGGSASTTGGPWSNFDVAGGTRGYTPSDADSALQSVVNANTQSYNSLVAALGGKGSAQFNLAYDTDPQGTAGTRIKAGATVNGQMVYGDVNRQFGSDSGDALTADLSLEAQRTLLAALQASDLPDDIANLLNSVTASNATADQISQILAAAQAVGAMNTALATLGDPLTAATKALATAGETSLETYDDQRTALYNLANTAPDTVDGLNSVTTATEAFAQSTVTLLAGILNAKKALDDMFSATRQTIQQAGMTDAQKYAYEQQQAATLFAQLQTATDPDQIKTLSTEINDAINTAFGLLTPDQQTAAQADFLAGLDKVQTLTDQKLTDAANTIATQAKSDQQFMSDQLDKILKGISDAGDTFSNAADKLNPLNVNVTVNTTTQEVNG